jgi:gamma-glutamylcyclotransferase (GGCT)/AIG2-like uncharacterized protein YtfP
MAQLFVYGSLLRGEERAGLIAHLDVREATVRGRLWRAQAGYPVLELNPKAEPIHGEVLRLDKASVLTVLDLIEGVNEGKYKRVGARILTEQGFEEAWVYVMDANQRRRAGCVRLGVKDWRTLSRHR